MTMTDHLTPEDLAVLSAQESDDAQGVDIFGPKTVLSDHPAPKDVVLDLPAFRERGKERSAVGSNPVVRLPRADGTHMVVTTAQLAMEIVMYGDDLDSLCATYNVHPRQIYRVMADNALLASEIEDAKKLLKNNTRLQLRMRDVLETYSHVLPEILSNPLTPPASSIAAYTLAARLAGVLDVKDDGKDKAPPVSIVIQNLNAGADIKPVQSDVNRAITIDVDSDQ